MLICNYGNRLNQTGNSTSWPSWIVDPAQFKLGDGSGFDEGHAVRAVGTLREPPAGIVNFRWLTKTYRVNCTVSGGGGSHSFEDTFDFGVDTDVVDNVKSTSGTPILTLQESFDQNFYVNNTTNYFYSYNQSSSISTSEPQFSLNISPNGAGAAWLYEYETEEYFHDLTYLINFSESADTVDGGSWQAVDSAWHSAFSNDTTSVSVNGVTCSSRIDSGLTVSMTITTDVALPYL